MIAYTDGSAHPNPGPGGFGVVIIEDDGTLKTYAEHFDNTTNNAMEMRAIIWASCYAELKGQPLTIYSDSAYAINTFTQWMYGWQRAGWVKGNGAVPENLELVKCFYNLPNRDNIKFIKVKGHNNDYYNELADKLATGV